MNEPKERSASTSADTSPRSARPSRLRVRVGLITTLFGLFVFFVGTKPAWFDLQRSPTVGFVKISVFLVGLAIICLGGYTSLWGLWKGMERSIAADIGLRLVATGYRDCRLFRHGRYIRNGIADRSADSIFWTDPSAGSFARRDCDRVWIFTAHSISFVYEIDASP